MAKLSILAGTTSKMVDVFIQDSTSTTGGGLTGLTNASSGLVWYYHRDVDNAATQVTAIASMTLGTWTTKGFIVVDGTNMPGFYQLGLPNAAIASGAKTVTMMLKGATNMVPLVLEIELTATDNQTATLTAAQIATGVWQDTTAGDFTTALSVGKSLMNGVSLGTGLTVARCTLTDTLTTYTGNTVQTGDAFARIGVAGVGLTNLGDTRIAHLDADVSTRSTYAGGAVASVTGNVGGNVVGSVASVTAGVTVTTNNDKTGYALTAGYDPAKTAAQAGDAMALTSGERNSTADALLDRSAGVETNRTPRQTLRLMAAVLLGKASGLATTTATYRDTNDSKDRIVATVDTNGNRSAVTLDAS